VEQLASLEVEKEVSFARLAFSSPGLRRAWWGRQSHTHILTHSSKGGTHQFLPPQQDTACR